jgi:hypothetical protein
MAEMQLGNKRVFLFPVENPVSGDDIPRLFVPRAFLVQEIRALKIGGGIGSFDWEIRYDPDANQTGAGTLLESDTGVSNNTTGAQYLPPFDPGDPAIIPAANWVWLELPTVSTGLARPVAVHVQLMGVELGP